MENVKAVISIHKLNIKFGAEKVLNSVDLELSSGQIYALIGPNGSGKTTLMNSITGEISFEGEININGKKIQNYTRRDLAQLVSKVQSNPIINNIKVQELIEMGRIPFTNFLGKLKKEDQEIIYKSVKLTKIEALLNKSINELSDGEKRKVLITKSLVQDCPIMLMDEPTNFLDIGNKYEFYQLLQEVNKNKEKTMVISTHDLDLAFNIADKILLIKDQNIQEFDPQEVKEDKILEEVFKEKGIKLDENGRLIIRPTSR